MRISPRAHGDGLRTLPGLALGLMRDPIKTMQTPKLLTWSATFALQAAGAMASIAVLGILNRSVLAFVIGLIIFPLIVIMTGALFTLLAYYYFALFRSTYLDIHRLHTMIAMASFPYFLIHSFSGFIPPLDLLGFAFSAILMIVALIGQFGLHRGSVFLLAGGAFAIFSLIWSVIQYFTL